MNEKPVPADFISVNIFPASRKMLKKKWIHIVLFVLTILSTYFVGLQDGPVGALWYSGGLIAILLSHEMGHYLMARHHGIPATLPYFIPFPFPPFGTMGAVIKMGGRIPDRRALFDVGVAGPLAGLAIIIPAVLTGLKFSSIVNVSDIEGEVITLGDSLLFSLLSWVSIGPLPEGFDVVLHPLAFAGWVGLLVTTLNLLPVGQLDGGHIVYSIFWKKSGLISNIFYGVFIFIFLFYYVGWILPVLLLLFIRKHPSTLNDGIPLDPARRILGIFAILVFILAFTPVPFGFGDGLIPILLRLLR